MFFQKNKMILLLLMAYILLLSGCGGKTDNVASNANKSASSKSVLKIYSWEQYNNKELIEDFEKSTGIKIVKSAYNDNDEVANDIKNKSELYDLAIVGDFMVDKLRDEDLLIEMNRNNISNSQFIDKRFEKLPFDSESKYSLPIAWGTLGLLYNQNEIKTPVEGWEALWNDKYARKIEILRSQRAVIASGLKALNYSLNTTKDNELNQAKEILLRQRRLFYQYYDSDIGAKMLNGESVVAMTWSFDAMPIVSVNPEQFKYIVPKEGSNWFVDNVVMLKSCSNKEAAEKFINYLCEPEVAYKLAKKAHSFSTNSKAIEKLSEENAMYKDLEYPQNGKLRNCEMFKEQDSKTKQKYDDIWKGLQ